jgi:hypothetical protein
MAAPKGRNCRLEIVTAFKAPITLASGEITKADPGIINHTAHGFAVGEVGLLRNVVGMAEIDGQALRAGAGTLANVLELEGLDTSLYSDFTSGDLVEADTWGTLALATSLKFTGGDGKEDDVSVLIEAQDTIEFAGLNPIRCSIDQFVDPWSPVFKSAEKLAIAGTVTVFRATYFRMSPVRTIIWAGQLSASSFEQAVKSTARGSLTATVKGRRLFL